MKMIVSILFVAFGFHAVLAGQGSSCDLTAASLETEAMECVTQQGGTLMFAMMGFAEDRENFDVMEFVCKHKDVVANIAVCMENKLVHCIPVQAKLIMSILPDKQKLNSAMDIMCKNRDLLNSDCATPQMAQDLMTCQQQRAQTVMTSLFTQMSSASSTQDIAMKAMCAMVKETENCLKEHHGKCSNAYLSAYDQVLEALFPMDHCDKATQGSKLSQGKASKTQIQAALSSILRQGVPQLGQNTKMGSPLMFQREGLKNYHK